MRPSRAFVTSPTPTSTPPIASTPCRRPSFGHDEYLYQVLCASQHALPPVALRVVRYHSLYAWHHSGCYKELESPFDADTLKWVKILNRHDLYSKRDGVVESEEVRGYYESLAQRYLPGGFNF